MDRSLLEEVDVILDGGTSDTGVHLDSHVLSDGVYDEGNLERELSCWRNNQCLDVVGSSVYYLQRGDSESSGFTSTRLSLYDNKLAIEIGWFKGRNTPFIL